MSHHTEEEGSALNASLQRRKPGKGSLLAGAKPGQTAGSLRWWQRERWRLAAASFLLGVVYSWVADLLGIEVRLGERDLTLLAGAVVEVSFAVFGFLIGITLEARRRERNAAHKVQLQLEELAAAQAKLAQGEKLASLGQMAAAIAHEVRNPLAILRSMAQNLGETLLADSEERTVCGQMCEEIDRLAHVTQSIVRFCRPLEIDRQRVTAADVVQRSELLAGQLLGEERLRLVLQPPELEAELDVDADLICQVLLGLLANAAEAVTAQQVAQVSLSWQARGDQLELRVRDCGVGIAPELRERIFDPFFTTRSNGNGLGLAVARQIVEAHGGTLEAEDLPQQSGASFLVRLPLTGTSGSCAA